MEKEHIWEVIIVGAGMAGLSAAIYLGRAQRRALVVHSDQSMATWEPHVQNYLGFPEGIAGEELLRRGRLQAQQFGIVFHEDTIRTARGELNAFELEGTERSYECSRILLATGIFHVPPEIPDLNACLGHSMFFCKDCDGFRIQGRKVAIVGRDNETIEYALGMLLYSPAVCVLTNGKTPVWDAQHATWLREYGIPLFEERIHTVQRNGSELQGLVFKDGRQLPLETLFTTRGDIVHNRLAKALGARLDEIGQVLIDEDGRTSVPGLYAAGCVTPANCQMIIAAGQGAIAAQAINRDLFEEGLETHSLRRLRQSQIEAQMHEMHPVG